MEHDARDPERRTDDGPPEEPISDETPSTVEPAETRSVADAPADLPPDEPIEPADRGEGPAFDRPADAVEAAWTERSPEPEPDAGQRWPEADLEGRGEPAAEETWPERVEPEAAAAWPSTDTAATSDEAAAGTADREIQPDLQPSLQPERDVHVPPPSEAEAFDAAGTAGAAGASTTAAAHAVPATNVSESTRCPRCGTENRPGLAFCSNCGQRLVAAGASATVERPGTPEGTQACPRCGTHNRAGVAFCQNCGANLRATTTAPGYVPPAVATDERAAAAAAAEPGAVRGGAILGPVVLIIGAIGIAVGWLLPFAFGGQNSLYDRAFGTGGYGAAFWNGYPDVTGGLADQAYFGFAGPTPILVALLVVLAIAGVVRAVPGSLQRVGLGLALIWALGLIVLFVIVEVFGGWTGDIVGLLRNLSPGGIIFFLASLIVLIGTLTRFARS